MKIIATFEAHDQNHTLLPIQEYEVVKSFECFEAPYVMAIWVRDKESDDPRAVVPRYLTREQLSQIVKDVKKIK
jgi:hypothetical protein